MKKKIKLYKCTKTSMITNLYEFNSFLSLEFQDIISYIEKETWGSLFLLIYSEYRIWASDIIFCEVESKNKNKKMEKVQIIKPDIFFDSYNGIDSLLKIENKKSYKSQMFPHIF